MIYIIDDKRSRQRDYGWDEVKFSSYGETIVAIWNYSDLLLHRNSLLEQGSVVLFHESFLSSTNTQKNSEIESIKLELNNTHSIYLAYFSGSKNARYVDGHICMLPPEVLYENLEVFISQFKTGDIDFKYLAFGKNFKIEEDIRKKLSMAIDENIDGEIANVEKRILFAETKKDSIEHPFTNCDIARDWDFFHNDISDIELDGFVNKWLNTNKYDIIYIPLCFGNIYSDYLGLRLAMHIRLTLTVNQNSQICIYGVSSYEDVFKNECFDVLKLSGIYLIGADNDSIIKSSRYEANCVDIAKEIELINVSIPSNIGDNHGLANRWAILRWHNMLKWKYNMPQIPDQDLDKSLYFKWLVSKYGKRNKFKDDHKYSAKIDGIEGKIIAYIDDEYDKGWRALLYQIFEEESKAKFLCFDKFDKKLSKKQLINRIYEFVDNNNANCYVIDLRLHEDDFSEDSNLTGHEIAEYIKQKNKGNQIVVFTASNKIWNLKKELFKIGAIGYALKESPESNYTRDESKQQFIEFSNAIRTACDLSYLKDLYDKQIQLKKVNQDVSELDTIIELLAIDGGNNNQNILKSILLSEIVFLENYINKVDKISLNGTGVGVAKNVDLCKDGINYKKLTGHIFFKREEITKGHPNVVDVLYSPDPIEAPSSWGNVSMSDASQTIAALLLYYNLKMEDVKQYINIKLIRNTQVAHNGEKNEIIYLKYKNELILSVEKLVNFYNDVIVPVVLKKCIRNA